MKRTKLRRYIGRMIVLLFLPFLALNLHSQGQTTEADQHAFEVHEWGTFTTVAGADGQAMPWYAWPIGEEAKLPSFVGSGTYAKSIFDYRVRMETPVLYFYSDQERTVDVQVSLPNGVFSDFYPYGTDELQPKEEQPSPARSYIRPGGRSSERQPIHYGRSSIMKWTDVQVRTEKNGAYPGGASDNRYFHARNTDANPIDRTATIKENDQKKQVRQHEKFLFYRGATNWNHPVRVQVKDDQVHVNAPNTFQGQTVLVFERREGRMGVKTVNLTGEKQKVDRPRLREDKTTAPARSRLQSLLEQHGLFTKEAQAMVNTWKDVWLESGLRILYLLPQEETKNLLPIDVQPSPNNMERVMVWQTELITSSDRKKARRILLQDPSEVTVKQVKNQLREEFGRFWMVIVKKVKQNITSDEQLDHIRNNLGEDE